jgi:two-component system KDP operon response regulator KdpE
LHVDDEPLNRALVRAMIARADDPLLNTARLREAGTLVEARAAWADQPADVVLLDVRLPDGTGLELAAEIRAGNRGRQPFIVAMTADPSTEGQDAARAAGCDVVLLKPYTVEEFEAAFAGCTPETGR